MSVAYPGGATRPADGPLHSCTHAHRQMAGQASGNASYSTVDDAKQHHVGRDQIFALGYRHARGLGGATELLDFLYNVWRTSSGLEAEAKAAGRRWL